MKHCLAIVAILLPSLALAQRGGPNRPPVNAALSCSVSNPGGTSCSGYEQQWCVTDQSSTEGKAWRCSPIYHTWVKFGEVDTAGTVTTAAFADSLSANGANCNSGSAPLGVSATGAAEGCFAVQPLDAELTAIAALPPTNLKTLKGNGLTWVLGDDNDSGAGVFSFSSLTSGTNAVPAGMLVGNGSTLGPTGSGTVEANLVSCGSACITMSTEVAAFSSADIIGRCSDETGTGVMVFATAPTMTNPVVGTQSAGDNTTKAASTAFVTAATVAERTATKTLTGTTLDAEASGNSLVIPTKAWLPAAGCQASTATSFWDSLTANPATAACLTGSNTQKGVLDFDPTTNEFAQQTIRLPSDWSGSIDVTFIYVSAGAGNVIWGIQTICVADAESTDPAFNTASTVTDASNASATTRNSASITGITTTGCAAGELMFINVYRDAASASDTMTANDARLLGVELTMRRSM